MLLEEALILAESMSTTPMHILYLICFAITICLLILIVGFVIYAIIRQEETFFLLTIPFGICLLFSIGITWLSHKWDKEEQLELIEEFKNSYELQQQSQELNYII